MSNENPTIFKEKSDQQIENELNLEEREVITSAWADMVLGRHVEKLTLEEMDKEKLTGWMFNTLMEETKQLSQEWGIALDNTDTVLIEKIQAETDVDKKTAHQLKYVSKCNKKISEVAEQFHRVGGKRTKWNAWPQRLREAGAGSFNCIGAATLVAYFMEEAGVQHYTGNHNLHALNILKLADKSWWLIDFDGDRQEIKRIHPQIDKIEGTTVLRIEDISAGYRVLPVYRKKELPRCVMDMANEIPATVADTSDPERSKQRKEVARDYVERYPQFFKEQDLPQILKKLFGSKDALYGNQEIQDERLRIRLFFDFYNTISRFLATLEHEERDVVFKQMHVLGRNRIAALVSGEGENEPTEIKEPIKRLLKLVRAELAIIKEKTPQYHTEIKEIIITKLSSSLEYIGEDPH